MIQTSDHSIWLGTPDGLLHFDGIRFMVFNDQNTPGIKNNYCKELFEDRQKNLWISTNNGLTCLKNSKFVTYTIENGLTSNEIGHVVEDRHGNIWIATNKGLNLYKEGKITSYTTANGLPNNVINSVCQDRNNNLWIATTRGLACFKDGKFSSYSKNNGLSHDNIKTVYEDRKGQLWISSSIGLDLLKEGTFTRYPLKDGFFSGSVRSLVEDREGNLWLTTSNGLCKFNNGQFTTYTTKDGLSFHIVTAINGDRDGNLWIGTPNGLNRFNNGIFTSFNSKDGLSHDLVNSIYEDHEGSLWLGTPDGLNRLRDGKFTSFTKKDGLNDVMAISVIEDKQKGIWVSTSAGLNRIKDNEISVFSTKDGLSSVWIKSLWVDRSGRLWIGTDSGLNYYQEGKFFSYKAEKSLASSSLGPLVEDSKGNLWVGTDNGLGCFIKGKFISYQNENGGFGGSVNVIYEDKEANLWIGTNDGGLVRIKQGEFKTYKIKNGLCSNTIKALYADAEGSLWIGTNLGLNRFQNGKFIAYNQDIGLFENNIHSILEDKKGELWISSARGIFSVSKKELNEFAAGTKKSITCDSYGKSDGMSNTECIGIGQPAGWKSQDGRLWFPTMNGVVVIDPDQIKVNTKPPLLKIEKMIVDEESIDLSNDRLIIAPGKKTFEFQYTAFSFLIPEKVLFKYKLTGFEDKWQEVGTRRIAYYTGIPPGYYRFQVTACNNDGIWNPNGISFDFYLRPFFYQTWWFLLLCILFMVASGFFIFRIRVKQLEKRKKELEALVKVRTNQLANANQELEKLSIVASKTDNAVLIMNAQGQIEWLNEGFARMFEDISERLKNEKNINIMDINANSDFKEIFDKCLFEKKTVIYESLSHNKTGKELWTQTMITPILKQDASIERIISISSDITKIKEAEKTAEKEREIAEHANRAKSEFLARMSHEIRTPMNGVIGFTDMLLDTELSDEQADYARTINKSGEALITILNDILDFSKIEAGELTFDPIDFDPEITIFDICELMSPRIGTKPIELLCRIDDNVPAYIKADPGRFRQVIVNLMGNSVKFTEKGEIEISLMVAEAEKNKLKLHIAIRDTGIGIPADKIETVFLVFQQADGSTTRRYGGTGLGLSICRQIAKLMGGDVWVESQLGKGSTFHFTCWVEASTKSAEKKIQVDYLAGKRALIVDDNQTNIDILAHTLELVKMEAIKLLKPKDVIPTLIKYKKNNIPIDICIVDIQMPGFSGYDLAKKIRDLDSPLSTVPLLAFSSSTLNRSRKFKDAGFDGFLPKPIQRRKLIKMIERLLGETTSDDGEKKEGMVTQHTIIEEGKHSIRILLAEDNPINAKLALFILTKAGYQVQVVGDGNEAINTFTADPEKFDVILMDIQMPNMDGREATRILRKKGFKDIPIIAMTAESMFGDREKCLKAGMNDYISKPLKRDEFYALVKKWVIDQPM